MFLFFVFVGVFLFLDNVLMNTGARSSVSSCLLITRLEYSMKYLHRSIREEMELKGDAWPFIYWKKEVFYDEAGMCLFCFVDVFLVFFVFCGCVFDLLFLK